MASRGRQSTKKQQKRAGTSRTRSTARSRTANQGGKRARGAARSGSRTARRGTKQAARATRTSTRGRSAGQTDAISLLKSDHQELRKLLEQLKSADVSDRRERLLERVREAIQTHTSIEEEIFYPAFRDAAGNKKDRVLYFEALEEHHAVDTILPEVANATSEPDVFPARAKVLKDMIEHHVEEEEKEMFPRARKMLPAAELRRLGSEMATRKRSMSKQSGPLGAVAQLFSR